MTIEIVNSEKALNALIAKAHRADNALAINLHAAAFNCLMVSINKRDARPMQRLFDKLTPAAKDALQLWCAKFGNLKFNREKQSFGIDDKKGANADGARAIGPMDYRKETKPKVKHAFNFAAELKKLQERANRHNCSGKAMVLLGQAVKAA